MLLTGPGGETDPHWVEPDGVLPVERPDALLFLPHPGGRRVAWRMMGRRLLLGRRVVALDLTGLSSGEVARRMDRRSSVPGWLIVDAAALDSHLVSRLRRFASLQLAIVCPVSGACPLPSLRPLGSVLRSLSMKDATLTTTTAGDLGSLQRLGHLSLRGASLPAGIWDTLSGLRELVALDVAGARPASWASFPPSLPRLQWLDLSYSKMPAKVLDALAALPRLRSLRLAATPLRDGDLGSLLLCPLLTELDVSLTGIGDAGLAMMAEHGQLRALDLRETRVTDVGLPHLAELPGLRLLFTPPATTDVGLRWLDRLHLLEGLSLCGSKVTREGLGSLGDLRRLWWLEPYGTR